jgi:tetratricopeptide (TPR) repeat protein
MAAAALGAVSAAPPAGSWGARPAERFLLARRMLRDLDNLSGPRDVIPLAGRQVEVMQRLRGSVRGTELRELMLVQIQFADLLGWLHQDCGSYQVAGYWLDRALEWSHIAGDQPSVAFILARKSQLAGDMLNAAEAVAVAEAAMRHAGGETRLRAVAAIYASHGYALAGDRAACDRLCEQARSALDAGGGSGLPWAQFLDMAYIDVHHARSMAVLGDYQPAAERFRAAIDRLQPAYHRDRGVYLAREAAAHAGAGEAEHAADLGTQALAIGSETCSGRIFAELASLEQALAPAASAPAVARFRAAMDAAVLRPA